MAESTASRNGAIIANLPEQEQNIEPSPTASRKNPGNGFLFGMIMGIVVTSLGIKFLGTPESPSTSAAAPQIEQTKTSSQSVTVTEVSPTKVNDTLEATGTVAAYELIPVMSQATGLQITQILADEGDIVKAGQVLAYLDDSILRAELAQAQASAVQAEARLAELQAGTRPEELQRARENVTFAEAEVWQAESDLELAQKRVARNRNLEAEGAIARDRLDELLNEERLKKSTLQKAQARLREAQQQLAELAKGPRPEVITQAQASLTEARARVNLVMAQLKDTQVIAPVGGKIAERNARVGDVTSSSQTLFTIVENGRLELQVQVPETQLTQITPGQGVKVTSDAEPNLVLAGKVREIEPTIDSESRQGTVKVDLPVDRNLKPGMFLQASIKTSTRESLAVPTSSVLPQSQGEGIVYLVLPDNTVKAQSVKMGEILPNERVEITTGLNKGDHLVVKGAAYLKDGDQISIIK
jgi:multidrug efflux pump subunit AcrA (membrane-fusion protein)